MRIVFASDTHSLHDRLLVPDGDVFVHCGDFTMNGELPDVAEFGRWVGSLPHPHKVVVAGNHDRSFEDDLPAALAALDISHNGIVYLEDNALAIEGVRFWGSPWQPWFYDWAFNLRRGPEIAAKWELIPDDTDVLVTHGPPVGILDYVPRGQQHVGCTDLLARVAEVKPRVHAFGHIHEGAGVLERDGTTFVNASICDEKYRPVNPCRIVDLAMSR
jgi:Icc-related predicted phosphoesterase